MTFKQHIAKYITGNSLSDQLPEIAIIGLEEGLDTPSLRIVAGLCHNENPFQIEHYLRLVFSELQMEILDRRTAALQYACGVVDDIFNGTKELIAGVTEIKYRALESYNFFSESIKYCYDSIGFERVYGLFVDYQDVSNGFGALNKPDNVSTELMEKIKRELLMELKSWRLKQENGA